MADVTAPKTLADARIRLVYVPTLANMKAPTVTELEAGIDMSCRILKSDFRLSATDSETVDDQAALCDESNPTVLGPSNYEGLATIFRYFDQEDKGRADTAGDKVFQALKTKGTGGYMVVRETGKRYDEDWATGDEVDVFEILTDTPQKPSDAGGFIRRTVPLNPQRAELATAVAGGSSGSGGGGA